MSKTTSQEFQNKMYDLMWSNIDTHRERINAIALGKVKITPEDQLFIEMVFCAVSVELDRKFGPTKQRMTLQDALEDLLKEIGIDVDDSPNAKPDASTTPASSNGDKDDDDVSDDDNCSCKMCTLRRQLEAVVGA